MTGPTIKTQKVSSIISETAGKIGLTYPPNDSQMAALMGVSRTSLSTYMKGTALPKRETIKYFRDQLLVLLQMCDDIMEVL